MLGVNQRNSQAESWHKIVGSNTLYSQGGTILYVAAWHPLPTATNAPYRLDERKKVLLFGTRAANAMEEFAKSAVYSTKYLGEQVATTKDTMPRLLRAYVCANFGSAIFQNPETNIRFQVQLLLINAGQTPAYKIGFKVRADVLPSPLPQDFDFPVPDNPSGSESTLGGHAPAITLTGVVDRLYTPDEVAEIRAGSKRVYLFGTVIYEDVYHISRSTNFCFSVLWLMDNKSMGLFTRRHNDAT